MKDPWVRVKDEGELRAGMALQFRPCRYCGRTQTFSLLRETDPSPRVELPGGRRVESMSRTAWVVAGHCRPRDVQLGLSIREGRLYRLADDQLTDLSEERELETAR